MDKGKQRMAKHFEGESLIYEYKQNRDEYLEWKEALKDGSTTD